MRDWIKIKSLSLKCSLPFVLDSNSYDFYIATSNNYGFFLKANYKKKGIKYCDYLLYIAFLNVNYIQYYEESEVIKVAKKKGLNKGLKAYLAKKKKGKKAKGM